MRRFSFLILAIAIIAGCAQAITLNEAKQLYLDGDFESALPVFEKALAAKPRDGSLNQWVGVCLLRTGRPDEAVKYLTKAESRGVTEAPRYLAEIAFDKYQFEEAADYMESYEKALVKAKSKMTNDAAELQRKIAIAKPMFDGVEKIVIIDSVTVARDDFFKAYKLSPESGSLNATSILPSTFEAADETVVYMPESKELMIWAVTDTANNYELVQSAKMIGGKWETPHSMGQALSFGGGDSNFPFLMTDGVTLYFANNGDSSIGGYDIYMTRRDDDQGFLKPQNIGMPFNSPYDDYMFAIDEINNVGWWATDRNCIEDSITIYKFIPSELRVNYPSDDPELASKARIDNFRDTWEPGADYSSLLSRIEEAGGESTIKANDFYFAMPGGKIYRYWDDFNSAKARNLMENYLDAVGKLKIDKRRLATLRKKYASGDTRVTSDILELEKDIEKDRSEIKRLSNEVILAE
ncbi:MAG: CDC27 family protein [Muribaculum sp.]|nr:CDC27 family protein [Muribaculaceae bacterium]MCM1080605.1 CDC27 family protein [Muribaculum sp.]